MADSLIAWGVRFAASTYAIKVTADATAETLTFPSTGALSATTDYFMSGTGEANDLLAMIDLTLETHSVIVTATSALTASFHHGVSFTKAVGTPAVSLEWDDGATTLDKAIFGFSESTTLAAFSLTSEHQASGLWRAGRQLADDSRDRAPIVGAVSRAMSGKTRTTRIATSTAERLMSWRLVPQEKILTEYATSPRASFEYGWINSMSRGYQFRLYDDEATRTTSNFAPYRVADISDPISRSDEYAIRWDVNLSAARDD